MKLIDVIHKIDFAGYATSGEKVDALYEELTQTGIEWEDPTAADFLHAMSRFAYWVAREIKKAKPDDVTSPAKRAEIINGITKYIQSMPTMVFCGIHPAVFGFQLAMRVRRPRTIHQYGSNLCGPVSVLYSFAKTQPDRYAQFALDLFFKGKARFGGLDVEPSSHIRVGYPQRKADIPFAVDYVTLVSLRQCTLGSKFGVEKFSSAADETTLPGKIGEWLRDAGYSNVQDYTFFTKKQHAPVKAFATAIGQPMHLQGATGPTLDKDRKTHALASLQQAATAVSNGKLVILFTDGEVAKALSKNISATLAARDSATSIGHHHWMAVRKLQLFGDTFVKVKVITWGTSYTGRFDTDAFVSRYNGYLSADPI